MRVSPITRHFNLRDKQRAPRALVDAIYVGKTLHAIPGNALGKQFNNGIRNARNIDTDPFSRHADVDASVRNAHVP